MSDFNACVGRENTDRNNFRYRLHERNENGDPLIWFCQRNILVDIKFLF